MGKTPQANTQAHLKKWIIGLPIKNFSEGKPQKNRKSIDLTDEQISFIIQKCEYEIKDNNDIIAGLKSQFKKKIWTEENIFIFDLIKDIKKNFFDKCGTSQFVLQALTKEQEDYVLESGLEQYREARGKEENE